MVSAYFPGGGGLPCAILMSPLRLVPTFNGPGMSPSISAAATIPPKSCAMIKRTARRGEMTVASANAKEMAGLNNAPETRKNIQTLIIKDSPNARAMNMRLEVSMKAVPDEVVTVAPGRLAICVPPKAMNKNIVVPTNSPTYPSTHSDCGGTIATNSYFHLRPLSPSRTSIRSATR
jgi:hypothetical protein